MGDISNKAISSGQGSSSLVQGQNESLAKLPGAKGERQALLSEVAKGVKAQGPSAKEKLIDRYLKGEISLGELTFELKVFNSVVADLVLRDSKNNGAFQINSTDASKSGSGISQAGLSKAIEEKGEVSSSSSDEMTKRDEQIKEEKKEEQKVQDQRDVTASNLFDRESRDLTRAQRWREIEKLLKEEAEDYKERKLEEELLTASEEIKGTLAREREMKSRAKSTKRSVSDEKSGGGKKSGR